MLRKEHRSWLLRLMTYLPNCRRFFCALLYEEAWARWCFSNTYSQHFSGLKQQKFISNATLEAWLHMIQRSRLQEPSHQPYFLLICCKSNLTSSSHSFSFFFFPVWSWESHRTRAGFMGLWLRQLCKAWCSEGPCGLAYYSAVTALKVLIIF